MLNQQQNMLRLLMMQAAMKEETPVTPTRPARLLMFTSNNVYDISRTTGIATLWKSFSDLGIPNGTSIIGAVFDGSKIYAYDVGSNKIYVIDVDNVSSTSYNLSGLSSISGFSGMYLDGSNINMAFDVPGTSDEGLYQLNKATGALTRVGSATFDRDIRTLLRHNSILYGLTLIGAFQLLTINTDTLATTVVFTSVTDRTPIDIESDGTDMFLIGASTQRLYKVNISGRTLDRVGSADRFGASISAGRVVFVPGVDGPDPGPDPEPTFLLSETLSALQINAAAAGRFGGLTWSFTHNGQQYDISHCFTHGNGLQLRFATNAQAQAFKAADFTIDSGISGQSTFKSSVMDFINAFAGCQYRAFPGRYTGGQDFTFTIKE